MNEIEEEKEKETKKKKAREESDLKHWSVCNNWTRKWWFLIFCVYKLFFQKKNSFKYNERSGNLKVKKFTQS